MVNYSHRKMKEEEGRRIVAVDAFHVTKKSNKELKRKLLEEDKERKSATAALDNEEWQVKEVEKAKAKAKKAKEEAEKAWEEVEQHEYDVGVAETEEALKAEVPWVCRTYCAQVWDEALNQVGVEASSVLRKAESVY